ncbi:MAG: hypothetical protein ABI885_28660 [Gammaproteobacteria bacterium]
MHVKAEHCRSIDVRRWQREGILREGRAGTWQWSDPDTGQRRAAIGYRANGGSVTLDYSIDGSARTQTLWLTETPCNYGGTRQWFICPIGGERVAVLFLRAGRFACRRCQRISYASQSGDLCDRTWRKQAKAEAKLGPNWARPKGMHATTRERVMSIIWGCEERRDAAIRRCAAMRCFAKDDVLWPRSTSVLDYLRGR